MPARVGSNVLGRPWDHARVSPAVRIALFCRMWIHPVETFHCRCVARAGAGSGFPGSIFGRLRGKIERHFLPPSLSSTFTRLFATDSTAFLISAALAPVFLASYRTSWSCPPAT